MRRPLGATILLWLVLSLTVWSGLRFVAAIQHWRTLEEFAPNPGPLYVAASAGIWLSLGLILLWSMWQGKAWLRTAITGTGAGYSVWYWCDRLFFQASRDNWPFALVATLLLLILVIICAIYPGTTDFFTKRERYDR